MCIAQRNSVKVCRNRPLWMIAPSYWTMLSPTKFVCAVQCIIADFCGNLCIIGDFWAKQCIIADFCWSMLYRGFLYRPGHYRWFFAPINALTPNFVPINALSLNFVQINTLSQYFVQILVPSLETFVSQHLFLKFLVPTHLFPRSICFRDLGANICFRDPGANMRAQKVSVLTCAKSSEMCVCTTCILHTSISRIRSSNAFCEPHRAHRSASVHQLRFCRFTLKLLLSTCNRTQFDQRSCPPIALVHRLCFGTFAWFKGLLGTHGSEQCSCQRFLVHPLRFATFALIKMPHEHKAWAVQLPIALVHRLGTFALIQARGFEHVKVSRRNLFWLEVCHLHCWSKHSSCERVHGFVQIFHHEVRYPHVQGSPRHLLCCGGTAIFDGAVSHD